MPRYSTDRTRPYRHWSELSAMIRFGRADGRCEAPGCGAVHLEPHPVTGKKVRLTVAHLNHVRTDDRASNLRALCELHHFNYDPPQNAAKAAETRRLRRSP